MKFTKQIDRHIAIHFVGGGGEEEHKLSFGL